MPALEVHQLGKRYGRRWVLERVSFAVEPGEVYALAGPNGSGKTTIIRLVTGLAFPSAGWVRLLGANVHEEGWRARRELGAVVEAPAAFYPHLTGRQNLERMAWMSGIKDPAARVREVMMRLEVIAVADQKVAGYSLGQRQRLGIAAAILARPRVLVLDEPTSGLDPDGIGKVHELLAEEADRGVAVLLSTHHLREASGYVSKVGILGGGRLVDEVVLKSETPRFRVRTDDPRRASALLKTVPGLLEVRLRGEEVLFAGPPEEAVRALVDAGFRILELGRDYFDLYAYYRERMSGA